MIIQQKSALVNKKSRNQQKMLDDCADRTYNSPRSTKIEHQTEGGNTMAKAKRYTAEQLSDAEKMAATLANVPEEKRTGNGSSSSDTGYSQSSSDGLNTTE